MLFAYRHQAAPDPQQAQQGQERILDAAQRTWNRYTPGQRQEWVEYAQKVSRPYLAPI